MSQGPSRLDRTFRAVVFSLGIASILLIGGAWMFCPRSTNWDEKKQLCALLLNGGAMLALGASVAGIIWTACSQYPRWGYAAIIGAFFLMALVCGTML
jgi:hypothetical protein